MIYAYKHLLVEYDPQRPDPCFTPELIAYIESRQPGLTPRDVAKLDQIEWFVFHRATRTMRQFDILGLRSGGRWETRYIKRFNDKPHLRMINDLLGWLPPDFPREEADRWILPGYRLMTSDGERYYSLKYSGNLAAWRKRIGDNASHFETLTAQFDHGRFVVSDGREIEFADMEAARMDFEHNPDDF